MAKGGKREQQHAKIQASSEEQEEEVEVEDEDEDEEGDLQDEEQIDYFDEEVSDRDEQLLERIEEEIMGTEEPLKLTWAAIHKIKQQQKELIEKMQDQMRKIQDKYHVLRTPLTHKIAQVASGEIFEKQIYTQHELTKNLSVNKHKPQAIPGFWRKTLDSFGIAHGDDDSHILDNCTKLQTHLQRNGEGQNIEETIRVVFHFKQNPIITNKTLTAMVQRKSDQQFVKKQVTPIVFKSGHPKGQSSFKQYFNSEVGAQELHQFCQDLYRAYENSVFYYFNEPSDKLALEGQQQEPEQSEQQIKPVKKAIKGNKNKQDAPPFQKPDCKQQ